MFICNVFNFRANEVAWRSPVYRKVGELVFMFGHWSIFCVTKRPLVSGPTSAQGARDFILTLVKFSALTLSCCSRSNSRAGGVALHFETCQF